MLSNIPTETVVPEKPNRYGTLPKIADGAFLRNAAFHLLRVGQTSGKLTAGGCVAAAFSTLDSCRASVTVDSIVFTGDRAVDALYWLDKRIRISQAIDATSRWRICHDRRVWGTTPAMQQQPL
jgi:hypothetical protein